MSDVRVVADDLGLLMHLGAVSLAKTDTLAPVEGATSF